MMSPDVELREELAELSQYVHWLLMNIPNGDMSLAAQVRTWGPKSAECRRFGASAL